MKKVAALSFALLLLVGCESEEQKSQILSLKDELSKANAELTVAQAEIARLNNEMTAKNSKAEDLRIIKSYLDRLDSPVNRFKTGISYRDFSGVHAQILEVITQYGREDVADKYPDILKSMGGMKLDLDTISFVYSKKFGGVGGLKEFISVPDSVIDKYDPNPKFNSDYGWYADHLLGLIFGSLTSNSDDLWTAYQKYRN